MKKALLILMFFSTLIMSAQYSGGSGTIADPYKIATLTDLISLSANNTDWGKSFIQTANIDAAVTSGTGFNPIGNTSTQFSGSYNGQGNTISGIFIHTYMTDSGLFGVTSNTAALSNLGLVGGSVLSYERVAGSLIGNNSGAVSNCYATGTVRGGGHNPTVGGLIGVNSGSVSNCNATGAVSGSSGGSFTAGGLIGVNSGAVSNCYASGEIRGSSGGKTITGGLIGTNSGSISNCYATGAVRGDGGGEANAGGLTGTNSGSISNCYATGVVSGSNGFGSSPGGLVSVNSEEGSIKNSFYDSETSGQSDSVKGTPKTTAQMKTQSTFTSWDFVGETTNGTTDNWKMGQCTNNGYPVLSFQTIVELPLAPTALAQTFSSTATVANLEVTGTGTIKWYAEAPGGTALVSTTNLATGTYYVSQTISGCESTRASVSVTVNVPPAPATHLSFDGVDDYVSIVNGGGLNNSSEGTIETWVKWNGTQNSDLYKLGYFGAINSRQSNNVFSNQIVALNGDNPNTAKIVWSPYSISSIAITSSISPMDNTWVHLAITYKNGEHKLYINGVLDGSSTATGVIYNDTNIPLIIGGWIGDGECFSKSNIDEFRVWNVIRTAEQINSAKNCELQGNEPGLVTYYKFNQGFNGASNTGITTLTDATTNANNGTLTNFALTGTASNWLSGSPITTGIQCSTTTLSTSSFEIKSNIKIYPNPTKNAVTIESPTLANSKLQVVDTNGRVLMNTSFKNNSNTIDLSQFQAGLYLFKVSSKEGTTTTKVIKQ